VPKGKERVGRKEGVTESHEGNMQNGDNSAGTKKRKKYSICGKAENMGTPEERSTKRHHGRRRERKELPPLRRADKRKYDKKKRRWRKGGGTFLKGNNKLERTFRRRKRGKHLD